MFLDRETRQVLLCALKVLTKTFDGLTGLIVPVAEYFNKAGHSIHVALVLGIMLCGKNVRRKRLEIRLTFQLVTSHPRGLNSNFRFLYAACTAHALSFFLSWCMQTL